MSEELFPNLESNLEADLRMQNGRRKRSPSQVIAGAMLDLVAALQEREPRQAERLEEWRDDWREPLKQLARRGKL